MTTHPETDAEETVDERLDRREADTQAHITAAEEANQSAMSSLSSFMQEIRMARRLLSGHSTPADALLAARDKMRDTP